MPALRINTLVGIEKDSWHGAPCEAHLHRSPLAVAILINASMRLCKSLAGSAEFSRGSIIVSLAGSGRRGGFNWCLIDQITCIWFAGETASVRGPFLSSIASSPVPAFDGPSPFSCPGTFQCSRNSNVPSRETDSSENDDGCMTTKAVLGYFFHIQTSSDVTSITPYPESYLPGAVARPISTHVSLIISASSSVRAFQATF